MSASIDLVRAGDFTGDGNVDLVISRICWDDSLNNPQPIQIFVGDGRGGFVDQTSAVFNGSVPTTNYVARMLIADFNNDGASDIYCIDEGDDGVIQKGQNKLFLSASDHKIINATSILPQESVFTHGASSGDINNDGRIDILANHMVQKANDMQMQGASGQFVINNATLPKSIEYATNTWSALIDVNGDGWRDMMLGTWSGNPNPSQVFLNDGHGSFSSSVGVNLPRSGVNDEAVVAIQSIDLNGDKLADLVLSVTDGGSSSGYYKVPYLQFLVNDGNGNFHDETALRMQQSTSPTSRLWGDWFKTVDVVDINHDGYSDIFAIGDGQTPPAIFLNDGAGKFTKLYEFSKGDNERLFAAAADVNNDGMTDFVIELGDNQPTVVLNPLENKHIYKANFGGDNLLGSVSADTFYDGDGSDVINGGLGVDTCVYSGSSSSCAITHNADNSTTIKISSLTDTLTSIERLQFSDKKIALDVTSTGNTGKALEFIGAIAYNLVSDKATIGEIQSYFDAGYSMTQICQIAVNVGLTSNLAGSKSNADLAKLVLKNVIGTTPSAADIDALTAYMDGRVASMSQSDFLSTIATLAVNDTHINLVGLASTGVEYV